MLPMKISNECSRAIGWISLFLAVSIAVVCLLLFFYALKKSHYEYIFILMFLTACQLVIIAFFQASTGIALQLKTKAWLMNAILVLGIVSVLIVMISIVVHCFYSSIHIMGREIKIDGGIKGFFAFGWINLMLSIYSACWLFDMPHPPQLPKQEKMTGKP